jgi:hypothetical protein
MKSSLALALLLSGVPAFAQSARSQLADAAGGAAAPAIPAIRGAAAKEKKAEPPLYAPIASCSGQVDGMRVELDFFSEELESGPTGKGLAFENLGGFKLVHRLEVKAVKGATAVSLYAALDPSVLFSEFTIPSTPASKVTVFAKHFHAVWAVLDCATPPAPGS